MCRGGVFCTCASGLFWDPAEVEAARQRVAAKRAVRRMLAALGIGGIDVR
jgi:hypothetical protein